jgi:hypothetical protein
MDYQRLILSCFVGAGVGVAVIALILRMGRRMDSPRRAGELHHASGVQKSRLGGVALAAAFVSVVLLFNLLNGGQHEAVSQQWAIVATSLAMFGLGLWDDLFTLGAKRKFIGQLAIASAAYFLGIQINHFQIPFTSHNVDLGHIIDLGFWSWPVTVFWLVALTNLINLIDGVDGLAGGNTKDGDTTQIRRSKAHAKSCTSCPTNKNDDSSAEGTPVPQEFNILSQLLAEGWARAIAAWEKQNQLPVRFNESETPVPENQPKEISGAQPETF